MSIGLTQAAELAFLAMYAEDMHHTKDAGAKLLAPDPDPRLAADYDVQAYLVANDSILPVNAAIQVGAEPLYYGFVARKKADPTSWIAGVRGTDGTVEWIIDGQFLPQDVTRGPGMKVEHGFWSIYETMTLNNLDGSLLSKDAAAGIAKLVGASDKVTVVGHSLGSALATYLAFDLARHLGDRLSACLFASPRTGNKAWTDAVQAALQDRYLVVNYLLDIVPHLPSGPDYCTVQNVHVLRPSNAEAGIAVDPFCDHHVLCYAAMLSYPVYRAHEPALLGYDASEHACVRGDAATVTQEAKMLEKVADALQGEGYGLGKFLQMMVRFTV